MGGLVKPDAGQKPGGLRQNRVLGTVPRQSGKRVPRRQSNLVRRATRDGNNYFGGLVSGNWRGGLGTTWEARIKLNCLTGGCWPAWWLSNDFPGREGEVDLLEWYGNGEWPAGTTVHAASFGTAFETRPIGVDGGWHTWRVTWNQTGFYFWEDYADGMEPYFSVPATGIEDLNDPIRKWPFNDPDYNLFAVLNLAVGGSGGGDPASGSYPARCSSTGCESSNLPGAAWSGND